MLIFRQLEPETMESIAEKYLDQLRSRAKKQGLELSLPRNLAAVLAGKCSGKGGARQLRSVVQSKVEGPLAGYLLECGITAGKVTGALVEDKLVFS